MWAVPQFRVAQRFLLVAGTPEALKHIFQNAQRKYEKDLDFSFAPFLAILGTGLVTAHGDLWQQQRVLIGPALRHDILEDVPGIAARAAARLIRKLEPSRGTGRPVDLEHEFRLLTLQIIGEAVLSLPPEECDKVRCSPPMTTRSAPSPLLHDKARCPPLSGPQPLLLDTGFAPLSFPSCAPPFRSSSPMPCAVSPSSRSLPRKAALELLKRSFLIWLEVLMI